MKRILITFCFALVSGWVIGQEQILDENTDLTGYEFMQDPVEMAQDIAEQRVKDLMIETTAKALSSNQYTAGVASQMMNSMQNAKLSDIIVEDKNYNNRSLAVLGNLLKLTKEARDGTIQDRAFNELKQAKLIKQSIDVISKANRVKKTAQKFGYDNDNLQTAHRLTKVADVSLSSIENLMDLLSQNSRSIEEKEKMLKEVEKKLEETNRLLDDIMSNEMNKLMIQLQNEATRKYNQALLTELLYSSDLDASEGREQYISNMSVMKKILLDFKNVMWILCGVALLIGAVSVIYKYFMEGTNAFTRSMKAWFISAFLIAFISGIIEYTIVNINI